MLLDAGALKKNKRANPDFPHVEDVECPLHYASIDEIRVVCHGTLCPVFRLTHPHAKEGENNYGLGWCGLGGRP